MNQYKKDIFDKLNFQFEAGKKLLDVGCGDGSDAVIFRDTFHLNVECVDIYEHENIKDQRLKLNFKLAGVFDLPFPDETFDYIFMHDVLHHVDEERQSNEKHIAGLVEVGRVLKKDGVLIIVEGNRYNPLFYPHMVKMHGHDHFRQSYFKKIISDAFGKDNVEFKFFEAHLYPEKYIKIWKLYEFLMEKFSPKSFLSYNVAIIRK